MTAARNPPTRQVAESALAWLSAHRNEFALGDDALAAGGHVNGSWKPLGELAQVCASIHRHTAPSDALRERASDLLSFAWRQTGEGELFLALQRAEPFATYPLEVYAAFVSAGLRHPGYEAAAATVARTRGWRLTEQYPTRRLGMLNAERRAGISRPERTEELLPRTWLGGMPEPWTFERDSGYALTHVVFHLTDWGRTARDVPHDLASYLAHWLPAWLDTCMDALMWDLGCELLAVAASVPRSAHPATVRDAWRRIAAAQDSSGALPENGGEGEDGGAAARDFVHCYHSTLMAGFAAVLTAATAGEERPDD
ncbi:hypothetical protein GCM10010129_05000 [Streptomyces fumigatiscleroticus]|nr:hypothetical protein GCM10010129_05000 [Streptomyces fumigatiscleroticus]